MRRSLVIALAVCVAALASTVSARPRAAASRSHREQTVAKSGDAPESQGTATSKMIPGNFSALAFRSIGPALTSGRVIDIAVHPWDHATWYVAAASGGVWKTTNAGTTWSPIFDGQVSFSIGCVAIDPKNPLVVWVGTGENNSQRSVSFGDGLYRSMDGGKSWENVGLKDSEHIGKVLIDPRDSKVVYVAAQGPLWGPGGDRGLYRTADGGATWKKVLDISEDTGVSDVLFDPRNPDILYATAYQRRRHVWTLIDGGPEGAVYRSLDAGANWKKLTNGLPSGDIGRIGLAISPVNPDVIYALVEATDKGSGFYRSTDAGGNWEKMSDYLSTSPQYYQEITCDPKEVGRVYSMDTFMMVTEDGGKNFHRVGEKSKHVDNHALWIDPDDTDHMLAGCDGGLYQTYDRGATWSFFANLPITQFYRVAVDNSLPFYYVYGGTQDNNTLGGPSQTTKQNGIVNSDWFITTGGDGFWSTVDPVDPNIVYSESQYGGLVRYDRKSGEEVDIQPQPGPDGAPLRWNWDAPILVSPHSHTRLYFAANRLFKSDDRGDTWTAVSPDLTRQVDRNRLKVMGRVWGVDAVAKNASTSFYGNIVSLDESPLVPGLLYAGTDDGLIQVSENDGGAWRKVDAFPGVPAMTYVSRLTASVTDPNVVFAAFDNHKMADFKPYLYRSNDRGRSWSSITGDLPARGPVYAVAQDREKPDLLFAGTEFGVFFTVDGGRKWVQLKGGLPPIAVRDIAIQRRDNDLVLATFGRGFYILDDYTPLRRVTPELLDKEVTLFDTPAALMYIPSTPLGGRDKSSQGESFFTASNPPFGAMITWYLKDEIKSRKKARQDSEKEIAKKGGDIYYPSWDSLRAESREEDPAILITVTDEDGNVVRRMTATATSGFHRQAWDLRYPNSEPTRLAPESPEPWDRPSRGPMAAPGTYKVSLARRVDGVVTPLAGPISFEAVPLSNTTLPAHDRQALLAFQRQTARLQRAVLGASEAAREADADLKSLKQALQDTPGADPKLRDRALELSRRLKDLQLKLDGDPFLDARNEPTPPSIKSRVQLVVGGSWSATAEPTQTHRQQYDIAADDFGRLLPQLTTLIETDLAQLKNDAEAAGAPWTPGRLPRWTKE